MDWSSVAYVTIWMYNQLQYIRNTKLLIKQISWH